MKVGIGVENKRNGTIHFVGAGPGAIDLITVRGRVLLEKADLVIFAGSLVNPAIMHCCSPSCVKMDSSKCSLEEVIGAIKTAIVQEKRVVRLHTGDPALYGTIGEQMRELDALGISYEVTPGITSLFAAAARLKTELTLPGVAQSVILTRTAGRTPMPEQENVENMVRTGATLSFYLSVTGITALMDELKAAGKKTDTPVAVVYRVGWPNEKIVRGTIDSIAEQTIAAGITRQALILVGDVLHGGGERSLLYDAHFSHGYRNSINTERFLLPVNIYAFSKEGVLKGTEIAQALERATLFVPERLRAFAPQAKVYNAGAVHELVEAEWRAVGGHVFMGATGIAVRMIAPLLESKDVDPAVVVCGEQAKQIISLSGGHLGGANRLTRKIARITGGEAIITTATDGEELLAFDEMAAIHHWRVENPEKIKLCNSALLENKPMDLLIPQELFDTYYSEYRSLRHIDSPDQQESSIVIVLDPTDNVLFELSGEVLILRSRQLVLGVGCKRGVSRDRLETSFVHFCKENRIDPKAIVRVSSATVKEKEEGLLAFASSRKLPIVFYPAEELALIAVPSPSKKVNEEIGTSSVSEASALLAAGGPLRVPKQKFGDHTFSVAEVTEKRRGSIVVVGLGSGSTRHITPEVSGEIRRATTIAGYTKYVDFIRERVCHKSLIESGMRGEIERCERALKAALLGERVCMVCSGDGGVLAMAGLLYEMQMKNEHYTELKISVKPGITAANIAASTLGAPLQNGAALISLSDLLVPSDEVRKNLQSAAVSNLTCVLYNPAGRKRRTLLKEALEIFRTHRGDDTLSAIVFNAGREEEEKWIGALRDFPEESVTMSSLVLIGGDRMRHEGGILYEERGYGEKYGR